MIVKYIEELAGESNKILSIIKKLLEKGIPIDIISETNNLNKLEILKLQNNQ